MLNHSEIKFALNLERGEGVVITEFVSLELFTGVQIRRNIQMSQRKMVSWTWLIASLHGGYLFFLARKS